MYYYPVETRVTALTTIRRERMLPAPGQVLVRPGEVVGPADVVARCQLPGQVHIVDVSRALRVRRDQAAKYIRKAVGDTVQEDDILAIAGGLLGRLRGGLRSPVAGQVIEVRDGLIVVESAGEIYELVAHVKGQISNIMPNRGVVISAAGSLIQGMWGSGGDAEGVLKVLVDNPQRPLRARSVDVSCHGTIIVGGRILDERALEQAIEAKVRGVVAGSVDAELRPFLESLPFPVLITEGFGAMPMSQPIFGLLHGNAGREAMLSTDTQTRWGARRPEVFIPLRSESEMPSEDAGPRHLQEEDAVRLLRAPYQGMLGTVVSVPDRPQLIESGARLPVARVELEDGDVTLIPVVNLEVIR
jgi:hypothetical protein